MLHQLDIEGRDKVDKAIMRIQAYEPEEGYYLCFSGGKDSCVIKALADMAGVKYDAHYSVTGIDPPDLVKFIKEYHPDVIFDYPRYKDGRRKTMWSLIPDSKTRNRLFRKNRIEILVPYGRMKFIHKERGQLNQPNFQSVYVCSGVLDQQITFSDADFSKHNTQLTWNDIRRNQ